MPPTCLHTKRIVFQSYIHKRLLKCSCYVILRAISNPVTTNMTWTSGRNRSTRANRKRKSILWRQYAPRDALVTYVYIRLYASTLLRWLRVRPVQQSICTAIDCFTSVALTQIRDSTGTWVEWHWELLDVVIYMHRRATTNETSISIVLDAEPLSENGDTKMKNSFVVIRFD